MHLMTYTLINKLDTLTTIILVFLAVFFTMLRALLLYRRYYILYMSKINNFISKYCNLLNNTKVVSDIQLPTRRYFDIKNIFRYRKLKMYFKIKVFNYNIRIMRVKALKLASQYV